jgi:hypothetical protein
VTSVAIAEMILLATKLVSASHRTDDTHTIYFEPVDATVAAAHPRAAQLSFPLLGWKFRYEIRNNWKFPESTGELFTASPGQDGGSLEQR